MTRTTAPFRQIIHESHASGGGTISGVQTAHKPAVSSRRLPIRRHPLFKRRTMMPLAELRSARIPGGVKRGGGATGCSQKSCERLPPPIGKCPCKLRAFSDEAVARGIDWRPPNQMCDKASPKRCVMLHLRSCYVSKAAILTIPVQSVPVENRSPA
jgi:hypothetical protein